jgi:hypothetical protein
MPCCRMAELAELVAFDTLQRWCRLGSDYSFFLHDLIVGPQLMVLVLAVSAAGRRVKADLAKQVRTTMIAGRRVGKWAKWGPFLHAYKTMAMRSQLGVGIGAEPVPQMQVG